MLTQEQIDIDKLADAVVQIADVLRKNCGLKDRLKVKFTMDAGGPESEVEITGSGGGLAGRRCT